MNAEPIATAAGTDARGFPELTIETPFGPLVVAFHGNTELGRYREFAGNDDHGGRDVTERGPHAYVTTPDGAASLRVHGIEYRLTATVCYTNTIDRKHPPARGEDWPRVIGWDFMRGGYGPTIYRGDRNHAGPTDKARKALREAILDAVEKAVAEDPSAPARAERHRRVTEAEVLRGKADTSRAQAAFYDQQAEAVDRSAAETPATLAELYTKE